MEEANAGKTPWEMTKEGFDLLMSRLDVDREVAGQKYEDLRLMLIKLFENRNINASPDHADEVINRLTRKLTGGEEIKSITAYALGVARNYLKEIPRRMREVPIDGESWPEPQTFIPIEAEEGAARQEDCFMRCLNRLRGDDREMILQYYEEEKQAKINHRRNLAQRLGLTTITLRTRACRVRIKLEECIHRCIADSTRHT